MINNYRGIGVIKAADASEFTFDGLWARIWDYYSYPDPRVYVRGFNDGVQVWSELVNLTETFQYVAGMTGAIDELRLDFGESFIVDSLSLSAYTPAPVEPPSAVPEPGSLALVSLGFVGCALGRRRKWVKS